MALPVIAAKTFALKVMRPDPKLHSSALQQAQKTPLQCAAPLGSASATQAN